MSRMTEDPRINPRFKAMFGELPAFPLPNVDSRDDAGNAPDMPAFCRGG